MPVSPDRSAGDVFFDMEGDPFFDGRAGVPVRIRHRRRGTSRTSALSGAGPGRGEASASSSSSTSSTERRERWPDLHVYHYDHYEVTALKRLAGAHGTREEELDQLLRDEVFVDLYQVVREAMRISQPSYSLKKVEAFYMDQRDTAVTDGDDSVVEFERWLDRVAWTAATRRSSTRSPTTTATTASRRCELRDWLLDDAASAASANAGWRSSGSSTEPQERERRGARDRR